MIAANQCEENCGCVLSMNQKEKQRGILSFQKMNQLLNESYKLQDPKKSGPQKWMILRKKGFAKKKRVILLRYIATVAFGQMIILMQTMVIQYA